jgi:hypothetical protein
MSSLPLLQCFRCRLNIFELDVSFSSWFTCTKDHPNQYFYSAGTPFQKKLLTISLQEIDFRHRETIKEFHNVILFNCVRQASQPEHFAREGNVHLFSQYCHQPYFLLPLRATAHTHLLRTKA